MTWGSFPRAWRGGFAFALVAGSTWGGLSSSCVIPDACILVVTSGQDWCRYAIGAQMWPIGHPELAMPVEDEEDNWPRGCVCFNDAESEILEGTTPADKYAELQMEIEHAARDECDVLVPLGWEHDCYDESPDGPVFPAAFQNGKGDCVGDCGYTSEPEGGCGGDPSPYQCEELGGGETGGEEPDPDTRPAFEGAVEWTR